MRKEKRSCLLFPKASGRLESSREESTRINSSRLESVDELQTD